MTTRDDSIDYYEQLPPPWWKRLLLGVFAVYAYCLEAVGDWIGGFFCTSSPSGSVDDYEPPPSPWWRRVPLAILAACTHCVHVVGGLVVGLILAVVHVAHVLVVFCLFGWQWRQMFASLPAVLVIGLTAGLAMARWHISGDEIRQRYIVGAEEAVGEHDYAAARTFYQKLILLGDDRPVVRYQLALCHEELGRPSAAQALLAPMTDANSDGFAPARVHRAQRLLADPKPSPAAVREATDQLERAVALAPGLTQAELLLAKIYRSAGRPLEAEPLLLQAARRNPAAYLALAELCRARGDVVAARLYGRSACSYFRPLVEARRGDEMAVLCCGQAYVHMEEYAAAVAVLNDALASQDSPALRRSLGGAYAVWANVEKLAWPANPEAWLPLLEQGLKFAPDDVRLLHPLLELCSLSGAEADRARVALEKMLVERLPSPILHLLLGLDAWLRGEQAAGQLHLEQAYRLAPDTAIVTNNLAFMLAEGPHPDLPRALALADVAVQRWPEQPHFRDTRGQILVKLGRYQEALVDLELALPSMAKDQKLHTALATTYDRLGMTTIAEGHRRQAGNKAAR